MCDCFFDESSICTFENYFSILLSPFFSLFFPLCFCLSVSLSVSLCVSLFLSVSLKIAVFPNGTSRCFAFIDFDSSVAAEEAHHNLNGQSLHGHEIRVSYSMPCRPGACILQPKPVGNPLGGVPPPTSIPTPLQEMVSTYM